MNSEIVGVETRSPETTAGLVSDVRAAVLSIAFHPELERIGDRLVLGVGGESAQVARHVGDFESEAGAKANLDDPFVSRQPVAFSIDWRSGLTINPAKPASVMLGTKPLTGPVVVSVSELERGVIITLSKRVVLVAHLSGEQQSKRRHGLVGRSAIIDAVRASVDRVADLMVPVLLRGETGVGKDLVARAIHAASERSDGPYVAINMGAIAPTTAVSELFGHAKGSFTGASSEHAGLFERANGGTIFLDEIGETPDAIQPMLLRVLETGEYLPVGATEPRKTNIRVIAATDADLELAEEAGTFRAALLHRLAGFEIDIPPLRERREDIGPLVVHFLREELDRLEQADRFGQSAEQKSLWFKPKLMSKFLQAAWPGNIRQLLNAVRQLVISCRGAEVLNLDDRLEALLDEPVRTPVGKAQPSGTRPAELTDDMVLEALRSNNWALGPTATALHIPRSTLYDFIDKSAVLRTAKDVGADALRESYKQHDGDLDAMSNALQVSKRGIRLRLRDVGLL